LSLLSLWYMRPTILALIRASTAIPCPKLRHLRPAMRGNACANCSARLR
jgi:hypothetical protein